jgi:hypothetical protein
LLAEIAPTLIPTEGNLDADACTDAAGSWAGQSGKSSPAAYRHGVDVARRQYGDCLSHFHPGGPACEALRDILTLCRANAITPILMLMPEGDDFRALYGGDSVARLDALMRELCYESSTPLIDARRWVGNDGFNDGHHLTGEGTTVFTARLADELASRFAGHGERGATWPPP